MKQSFLKPTKQVSERMKRVKSRGTALERSMEGILRSLRIRYVRQPDLLGHPDFRLRDANVLIFCDSSFWHGRREKEISGEAFRRNRKLWQQKLAYNRKRDERNNRILRKYGWSVQRFWDTDILRKPEKVKTRLRRIIHDPNR